MSAALLISIPQTSITNGTDGKPYTLYHVELQVPLRKQGTKKRYTDFVNLQRDLSAQTGATPPATLPPKNWIRRTVYNQSLTEQRRAGLERYLQAIVDGEDNRWRSSGAWRQFMNLPSGTSTIDERGNLKSSTSQVKSTQLSPNEWLDVHRDLKSKLQTIRQQLKQREAANTPQQQHSFSADAKANLVRAAAMTAQLEQSLTPEHGVDKPKNNLGEGEIRRRRDLVVSAKKEVQALEGVLKNMAAPRLAQPDKPNEREKDNLAKSTTAAKKGRVLGGPAQETNRTRELDNNGVLQLQQQIMQEQDEDVMLLGSTINRLKDMGIMMNEELTIQNTMLDMVEGDVDRLQGKIDVGRKRIQKIKNDRVENSYYTETQTAVIAKAKHWNLKAFNTIASAASFVKDNGQNKPSRVAAHHAQSKNCFENSRNRWHLSVASRRDSILEH
ncbi:hypothetical protein MRB53_042257 [Persea americana]|nr:hypothetical protein MRB53_042257 [Persea americana]